MDFDTFVLAAATADLEDEPTAREAADAIEFRMDMADDPVQSLEAYTGELPIIATNRPEWEGGSRADGTGRIEELTRAVEIDAVEAVDVELGALLDEGPGDVSAAPVIRTAAEENTAVIASFHDFDATPDLSTLADVASRVCTLGTVGKLSVTATGPGDVLDVLRVTHEFTEAGQSIATMAMGEAGRHSRVIAPLYGSKIGYAPVDPKRATAPGQYDLESLSALIDALR
ncbi:MAG: type I 3-dehydroquinate dehydratase [Halodesulfurarchaeum sp.]